MPEHSGQPRASQGFFVLGLGGLDEVCLNRSPAACSSLPIKSPDLLAGFRRVRRRLVCDTFTCGFLIRRSLSGPAAIVAVGPAPWPMLAIATCPGPVFVVARVTPPGTSPGMVPIVRVRIPPPFCITELVLLVGLGFACLALSALSFVLHLASALALAGAGVVVSDAGDAAGTTATAFASGARFCICNMLLGKMVARAAGWGRRWRRRTGIARERRSLGGLGLDLLLGLGRVLSCGLQQERLEGGSCKLRWRRRCCIDNANRACACHCTWLYEQNALDDRMAPSVRSGATRFAARHRM